MCFITMNALQLTLKDIFGRNNVKQCFKNYKFSSDIVFLNRDCSTGIFTVLL